MRLKVSSNRILFSNFLAASHMKWWVNFASQGHGFLNHKLQYNPRTLCHQVCLTCPGQSKGKWCRHSLECVASSVTLLSGERDTSHHSHISHTSLLCSHLLSWENIQFIQAREQIPAMICVVLLPPVTQFSCPPHPLHPLPPLTMIAA